MCHVFTKAYSRRKMKGNCTMTVLMGHCHLLDASRRCRNTASVHVTLKETGFLPAFPVDLCCCWSLCACLNVRSCHEGSFQHAADAREAQRPWLSAQKHPAGIRLTSQWNRIRHLHLFIIIIWMTGSLCCLTSSVKYCNTGCMLIKRHMWARRLNSFK